MPANTRSDGEPSYRVTTVSIDNRVWRQFGEVVESLGTSKTRFLASLLLWFVTMPRKKQVEIWLEAQKKMVSKS